MPAPVRTRRVAALYDIHGNLPALERVLAEVSASDVDLLLVGGDVLPGPMPMSCLRALDDVGIATLHIRGNGETDTLVARSGGALPHLPDGVRRALEWTASVLTDAVAARLDAWPLTRSVEVEGLGSVLFCHATPRSDREIFTVRTPEDRLVPVFAGLDAALVVCGHTHMAFERRVLDLRVLNAGSVGMPFGAPGAHWVTMGPEGVTAHRTEYDTEDAARRIRSSAYPDADTFARDNVLQVPPADVMLDALERASI